MKGRYEPYIPKQGKIANLYENSKSLVKRVLAPIYARPTFKRKSFVTEEKIIANTTQVNENYLSEAAKGTGLAFITNSIIALGIMTNMKDFDVSSLDFILSVFLASALPNAISKAYELKRYRGEKDKFYERKKREDEERYGGNSSPNGYDGWLEEPNWRG